MGNSDNLHSQLSIEVLQNLPSTALPSNLTDRWLDIALQAVEQMIQADEEADHDLLHIPVSLVLHLLSKKLASGSLSMSDEKLVNYLTLYRLELAMEKLRRWGVVLTPPADEATIFDFRKL